LKTAVYKVEMVPDTSRGTISLTVEGARTPVIFLKNWWFSNGLGNTGLRVVFGRPNLHYVGLSLVGMDTSMVSQKVAETAGVKHTPSYRKVLIK
jgi:hypothetical protein